MTNRKSLFADAIRALEPFAALSEQMAYARDDEVVYGKINVKGRFCITVGDLREARAALLLMRLAAAE